MSSPRFVFLDPDGTLGGGWLFVIVQANTGVVYQSQCGGANTRTAGAEGFLVPLTPGEALYAIRVLFLEVSSHSGAGSYPWPVRDRDRLREIIGSIRYWACDGEDELPYELELDDSRISEVDDAWVPVITRDGPGVLVWRHRWYRFDDGVLGIADTPPVSHGS